MALAPRPRAPIPERARGSLAALGLLGLIAAVFSEAWLTDRVFYQRDIYSYWYPHIAVFVRVVQQGLWPLWNPYVSFGTPLLADPNLQLAYPLTWLTLVLPPATYFKLFVLVHCLGAGVGAWLLARRLRLDSLSAFLVGCAWIASGPLLSSVNLFHHFASAAWIPWVLWALDRALHQPTVSSTLVLGAVAAGELLAGSADVAFMTALLASAVVAGFVLAGPRQALPSAPKSRRLGVVVRVVPLAVVYATLLAAVQWWPTLAQVREGTRLSFDPRTSMYWSLHPASLLDLVVPRLVAELPLNEDARAAIFEAREPLLASVYLGIPCLALAAVALLHVRRRLVLALAAGVAFFVLAAVGRHAPLLPTLLELPLFGLFRYPPKYLLPAALLWALLAGFGLETITRPASTVRTRGFLAVGLLAVSGAATLAASAVWLGGAPPALERLLEPQADGLAAVAVGRLWIAAGLALGAGVLLLLRWRLGPRSWLAVVGLLLAAGDLAVAGRPVNLLAPPELLLYRPPLVASIEKESPPRRVYVAGYPGRWLRQQRELKAGGGPPAWEAALGSIDRLRPPIGARWELGGSYDGTFTGQAPLALSLLSLAAGRVGDSPFLVRLLRLGGVDYVVSLHDPGLPELTEVARFESVYAEPVRLLRVRDPLPPVLVVGEAGTSEGADALYGLLDQEFDPRRTVLLPASARPTGDRHGGGGEARIRRWAPGEMEIDAVTSGPSAYLVVPEAWAPGWRALVDGEPVEVLKANALFCAIRLPGGTHRVQLVYQPAAAAWGAATTGLAIILGVAVWAFGRRRRVSTDSARD